MVQNDAVREMRHTPIPGAAQAVDPGLQPDGVVIRVKLCNLPPLNAIANRILALSADADVDLKQLAAVMECDPAFAADVLFLANSSLYGFPSRMQVLRHAIALLGLDCIKTLAMTFAMRSFVAEGSQLVRQCWRHSAACALIAKEISPALGMAGDRAYTAGLLHDIGRLGLLKSYTAEYSPVLRASFETVEQILQAEREAVNVDHGVAGGWLVGYWALPEPFIEICEHHHEAIGPKDSALLQTVKTACRLADALGFAAIEYSAAGAYDDAIQPLPRHVSRDLFPGGAELREMVEARLKSVE
jgi:HD-like signal output (HDOD) protein